MRHTAFIDFEISYRMVLLRMLYSMTLTYIFNGKYLKVNNLETVRASTRINYTCFIDFDICHRTAPL